MTAEAGWGGAALYSHPTACTVTGIAQRLPTATLPIPTPRISHTLRNPAACIPPHSLVRPHLALTCSPCSLSARSVLIPPSLTYAHFGPSSVLSSPQPHRVPFGLTPHLLLFRPPLPPAAVPAALAAASMSVPMSALLAAARRHPRPDGRGAALQVELWVADIETEPHTHIPWACPRPIPGTASSQSHSQRRRVAGVGHLHPRPSGGNMAWLA